ncbi:MAG: RNA polymerase sigma-54 factor [Chlorobi bacterium]|nr:MAG: RNA polymerase factor sigma-54 [Bacteroidota bacterium]KXK34081.1 MAG: DNA-directed RNA polymerase specialized sigma subunit [Chlorobi bacterium OLB6]MBE2265120.1 RNA polymerase factor sigma-54 [Flavobacteriales bacterium]MBL1161363.1 RNA polymerase sigma-54 factor [Chlorobiota bacterium]MBW7852650.1 RNA polymerase factor sigma-54 [Candidatus Kapabacteria bacterium]MCC6331090.1 RNA polymerase factor sigma-54 [Ignavibacteria bacterium]
MKLGLNLQTSLQQTLTPQQIQYLKLLQLSALQFEQHVHSEVENNPMLEEQRETADFETTAIEPVSVISDDSGTESAPQPVVYGNQTGSIIQTHSEIQDTSDGFEFYKLLWGEDPSAARSSDYNPSEDEDDDTTSYLFREMPSLEDEMREQIRFLPLTAEEQLLADYIIGNVDSDGYLRRPLTELVAEVNGLIAEHNLAIQAPTLLGTANTGYERDIISGISEMLEALSLKQAESVLSRIQNLDPPGFASRTVQECLVAQLKSVKKANAAQKLALLILTDAYEPFAMKHYPVIAKQLDVTEDYLREAIDVIRNLNPRPGGGTFGPESNTIAPDFTVEPTEDGSDFIITVNDSRLPVLRVSDAYDRLKKEARFHKFNKETREWLRKKYEDAKFLMQAIRQRKSTMLRVMTAIAGLQRDFFIRGPEGLRPLIYRDVSEITGLDISTVCRIVNGKYVQTHFGTFELKYFFSESLVTDDGEEVSTRIIKQKIKELIDAESKSKPLSDDKLAKDLKRFGYVVARRTVAKYREQLKIPVARLRKEL